MKESLLNNNGMELEDFTKNKVYNLVTTSENCIYVTGEKSNAKVNCIHLGHKYGSLRF